MFPESSCVAASYDSQACSGALSVIVMEKHHADSLIDFGVCGQIGLIHMGGVYCECHGG